MARWVGMAVGVWITALAVFAWTGPWVFGSTVISRLTSVHASILVLLVVVFALSPHLRRAAKAWLLRPFRRFRPRTVWLGAVAVSVLTFGLVWNAYTSLRVNAWDFSLYFDRPLARTAEGALLYSEYLGGCLLGNHANWVVLALAPFYAVEASPMWLLRSQALAVAGATAAGFFLFRRLTGDDAASALFAGAFLLNTYTARALRCVFHPEILYPLGIFLLLWAFAVRRPRAFAGAALLILSIKEDAFLLLVPVALVLAAVRRRPFWGVPLAGVAVAVFAVNYFVVLPAFHAGGPTGHWYQGFWSTFGETPFQAALGMIRRPWAVAAALRDSGVWNLLGSLAGLPLAGPVALAMAAPALVVYSVSDFESLAQFRLYYAMPVLPLLVAAAVEGARRLAILRLPGPGRAARRRRRLRLLAGAVFLAASFAGVGHTVNRPRPERHDVPELLAATASDLPVLVQGSLLPHAGYARNLTVLEPPVTPTGAEAFLLLPSSDPFPFYAEEISDLSAALAADPRYRQHQGRNGVLLYLPENDSHEVSLHPYQKGH